MSNLSIEYTETKEEKVQQRLESYARFLSLIKEKNISPYRISKDTGIATATLSDWKLGKSMPKNDKMEVISKYLNVSSNFIVYGNEDKYSDYDASLDARISEDIELKEAIKKYYSLDDRKKKHILELIDLLYEE